MKKFDKSHKLDNVNYEIRGMVMEQAEKMENEGIDILKLNIGNPAVFNFSAPDSVLDYMKENINNSQGYSNSKGLKQTRESILEYYKRKGITNLDINSIYTGNGVSELILMSMQALLDKGDEILVPMPDYPLWTAAVNLAGGTPIHYLCDENNEWYPNIKDIENKITNNTKGIVIINPNNPTGSLYPKEILEKIVDLARKNEIIIFSDEIYDRLIYDDLKHTSIAALSNDVITITFSGLSKSHMLAGFRIGWMCITGNKNSIAGYIEGLNLLSSMRLCSNVPAQYTVKKAIKDITSTKSLLIKGGRLYEQREYLYNALNQIPGISAVKPKAAFYIFVKIDTNMYNITDDEKFVLDFLKNKHILLMHGTGFNWKKNNYFRIVYLAEKEKLKYTVHCLKEFLKFYRQQ